MDKVLIAVVNPDQDPITDKSRADQFNQWGVECLSSPEEQWKLEGPILKVARKLLTQEDLPSAKVYLLYTRLSAEGERRKQERLAQGIALRVRFQEAAERAELTQRYLKACLGIKDQNIRLWPLDFDDENAADLNEWLRNIFNALKAIKTELKQKLNLGEESFLYRQYEFHIVCMGAAQVRTVFIACRIANLIHARLWNTPDPLKIRKDTPEEKDFPYWIDVDSLLINPHEQEQAMAQEKLLSIFKYGNQINVYVGGELVNLGRPGNPKAQLLYELAKARKHGRTLSRNEIVIWGTWGASVNNDYKSKLRISVNKAVNTHTKKLGSSGKLPKPIRKLIQADSRGWYLTIDPEEIHLFP